MSDERTTTVSDFLSGNAVFGYVSGSPSSADQVAAESREAGMVARVVRGSRMRTLGALFDEFAASFQFPHYFGHNKDAFDECMRDLDEFTGGGAGYVVVVRDSEQLLADEPKVRAWFDESMEFYAEEWSPTPFRVVLQGAGDAPQGVAFVNLRPA
ncbi:barstar family protein [Rhodococcus sp. NPDC058521]|uniref:barstar family protein n=1 Tax=Rhodococcus sp. NPDC058521 TaxID=3346536 RepID=UPI0036467367